ncbi:hypothetical protein QJR26_06305 [Clostridium baratii]
MGNNENQMLELENLDVEFDFEELEGNLSKQLEESFSDLEILEKDREKISDPDSFGKVIMDEIWTQFSNQIGFDMTAETLVEKYDREHPESYKEVGKEVMQDKRYKDENKKMRDQQQAGNLKDAYTGKKLNHKDKANLDHVVTRKELYENKRRKQANLDVKDLANKKENLQATNESLNKSKKEKSNKQYLENRETREQGLIRENEKKNKKVDESNMSETEKRLQKEKNNKRLQDKLDADNKLMMDADKTARKAINKKIAIEGTKQVGVKAVKDSIKAMVVNSLFALLKEIMNGLIRFFKEKSKSFKVFLAQMKEAIKRFFKNISSFLKSGVSTFLGTIVTEIFEPIIDIFGKISGLLKQGIHSLIDVFKYLRDKNNKDKPLAIKVAQVGKILTSTLVAGGAIMLGEIFEKLLLGIPGMQITIPLMGTIANVVGLFLASLVSGLVGAIILNFIDKFIAEKMKEEITSQLIDKKNEILNIQEKRIFVAEKHVESSRENMISEISENHKKANEIISDALNNIFKEDNVNIVKNDIKNDFIQMQNDLIDLI